MGSHNFSLGHSVSFQEFIRRHFEEAPRWKAHKIKDTLSNKLPLLVIVEKLRDHYYCQQYHHSPGISAGHFDRNMEEISCSLLSSGNRYLLDRKYFSEYSCSVMAGSHITTQCHNVIGQHSGLILTSYWWVQRVHKIGNK